MLMKEPIFICINKCPNRTVFSHLIGHNKLFDTVQTLVFFI